MSSTDFPPLIYPTTGQNRFLLHASAQNRQCSIFGTSDIGDTLNLVSDSDYSSLIFLKTGENRFYIACKCSKPVFYCMQVPNTGNVLFLEHQISVIHQIWHQIRIPHPSFTLKPVKTGFLLDLSAENRQCSIFEIFQNKLFVNFVSHNGGCTLFYCCIW